MGWFIHHVNLQAHDVRETAAFYRDMLGLEEGVWRYPERTGEVRHSPDTIAYFGEGNRGLHIVRAIDSFPRDNGLDHNPTVGGHFAIAVPDVLAAKARLEAAGVLVSDAGVYAMAGMYQIYCYDPWFNLIEINQVVGAEGGPDAEAGEAHGVRVQPGGWYLHHVNLQAHDVRRSVAFFEILDGLEEGAFEFPDRTGRFARDRESLAVFGEENRGLHLVRPQPTFARDNGFLHNPTLGGHVAITVPDLEPVTARLDAAGLPWTDAGLYAMAGVRQVYVFDPSMNLVEVNQTL